MFLIDTAAGPHRRRRGDQGDARRRAPLRRVARRRASSSSTTCPSASTSCSATTACCAASSCSATRTRSSRSSSPRWPRTAPSRSARWAPTRRSPCCRSGRACCSTTSRSSSRRSRTRRSTPSARRSSRRCRRRSGPRPTCSHPGPASCRQLVLPFPIIDNDELAKIVHANDDGALPRPRARTSSRACTASPAAAWRSSGRSTAICSEVSAGHRRRRPHHRALGPQRRRRRGADPVAAAHRGRAPPPRARRSSARWSACSSSAATPARCTTWRCSSATAPAPSTRTWRSSRSRTSSPRASTAWAASTRTRRVRNYIKACGKGVLKVMSKMGVSTVASYTGAQIFEAIGLGEELVDAVLHRHRQPPRRHRPGRDRGRGRGPPRHAHPTRPEERAHRKLELGGEYQWRREGEIHLFNPETVFKLQHATRAKRYDIFQAVLPARRRPVGAAGHAARPVRVQGRRPPAGPDRRGRAGRARSCGASRPAR